MTREPLTTEQRLLRAAMLFLMLGLLLKALVMPLEQVNWDTNYYLNIGSNFIERGELTPYMWRLGADTTIIAGSGTGYGVLIMNYWFRIFGLSLYSGYILNYIVGIVSLVVLFFLARAWWGNYTAGIVAIVFAALTNTFISQYYIRMDALGVLAYLLILWLHIYAVRQTRNWLHTLVGIAVIAGAEVHIQMLLYIGAISFYYLIEQIQFMRRERRIFALTPSIYYFVGAFVAGVIYLLIHVFPDPEAYFIIARTCANCTQAGIAKEIQRYTMFFLQRSAESTIVLIAIGMAYVRRERNDNHILVLLLGYLLANAIISPPVQLEYLSHLLPLMALVVGGVFINKDGANQTFTKRQLIIGIFASISLFWVQLGYLFIYSATPKNVPESVIYVQEHIPNDTVVMGLPPLFHHLLEYDRFLSYQGGENVGIILRDEDYVTFWEREHPQVFIGEPEANDATWWSYMATHDFKRVRPEVWIAGDLYAILISGHSRPDLTFFSEETATEAGACTMLIWSVENADSVTLDEHGIAAADSMEVCPQMTSEYTISAYWVGGIVEETIRIEVDTFDT